MKTIIFPAAALIALCLFSTAALSQSQTFTVTNNSGMIVTGVSISPNDAENWGLSLNTVGSVQDNQSFQFTHSLDKSNCVYDLRFTGEDGAMYYVQDVNLCTTSTITLKKPDTDMKKDMNDGNKMDK